MADGTSKKQERKQRTDGVRSRKMQRQRQAMIQEAIKKGSFEDRKDVKGWIKSEFQLDEPLGKVSTEYSLTDGQLKLWYMWLRYFTGKGPMPYTKRRKSRASNKQLWRIDESRKKLGWSDEHLVNFIQKQCHLDHKKMPQSLTNTEATKVITGMDRILAEQPFKRKHELKN